MPSSILFICTGNYYRSRFAEALFNHHATLESLPVRAFSRGLAIHLVDGDISHYTVAALRLRGIDRSHTALGRQSLTETDLTSADWVIALKHDEHRPLFQQQFPAWTDRVTYWHVHDLDCSGPDETFQAIEAGVARLLEEVRAKSAA